jgi:hypothetical protein
LFDRTTSANTAAAQESEAGPPPLIKRWSAPGVHDGAGGVVGPFRASSIPGGAQAQEVAGSSLALQHANSSAPTSPISTYLANYPPPLAHYDGHPSTSRAESVAGSHVGGEQTAREGRSASAMGSNGGGTGSFDGSASIMSGDDAVHEVLLRDSHARITHQRPRRLGTIPS